MPRRPPRKKKRILRGTGTMTADSPEEAALFRHCLATGETLTLEIANGQIMDFVVLSENVDGTFSVDGIFRENT